MSPSALYEAVMHCIKTNCAAVYFLGKKLLTQGIYNNTTTFPNPEVAEDDLEPEVTKLGNLITEAEGNSNKILERDAQSAVVHAMMAKNLPYVNKIADHDIAIINLSGYDSNVISSEHPLAPEAVIKDIVKAPQPHTCKVMLEKLAGEEQHKKESRAYIVYMFDDMTTEVYKIVCVSLDSRELLCEDIPYMVTKYFAVVILNSAGKNQMSARRKFTLTD